MERPKGVLEVDVYRHKGPPRWYSCNGARQVLERIQRERLWFCSIMCSLLHTAQDEGIPLRRLQDHKRVAGGTAGTWYLGLGDLDSSFEEAFAAHARLPGT